MINVYEFPKLANETESEYMQRAISLTYVFDNELVRIVQDDKIYLRGTIQELEIAYTLDYVYPELTDIDYNAPQSLILSGDKIDVEAERDGENIKLTVTIDGVTYPTQTVKEYSLGTSEEVLPEEVLGIYADSLNIAINYRPVYEESVEVAVYSAEEVTSIPTGAIKLRNHVFSRTKIADLEPLSIQQINIAKYREAFNDPCAKADEAPALPL